MRVLRQALGRSDVVITTGGLGPTVDDVTREAVARATDRALVLDEELVEEIACFFANRNYRMTDNNRGQARIPERARIIHNPVGTAPAFAVDHNDHVIICLPGVPHEMRHLMTHEVLPLLTERFGLMGTIKSRTVRTCGIGESTIDTRIADLMRLSNPTVGTRAHPGQTDIKITAKADSETEADALIAPVETTLRERLGDRVFGVDEETLSQVVVGMLERQGLRLALVETTTGGALARQMCEASQGNHVFSGAVIVPGAESLQAALGIAPEILEAGALPSQSAADVAATEVRRAHATDLGLAIIGPMDLASPDAPPVFFSLATADGVIRGESRQGRAGPAGQGWLRHLALDLVRSHLLATESV